MVEGERELSGTIGKKSRRSRPPPKVSKLDLHPYVSMTACIFIQTEQCVSTKQ